MIVHSNFVIANKNYNTMKKLFTLLLATLSIASIYATEPQTVYCAISGSHLASQANGYIGQVDIDFGQGNKSRDYLVDNNGKRLYFETMISALNHMAKAGWRLESSYTEFNPSLIEDSGLDECIMVMILSKEITSEEQIVEGIYTRETYQKNRW
jgi:hypothetical protein